MHFGQSIDKQQYQSCLCKSTVIFTEDENEKGGFGYIKYIINKLYSDCRIDLVQYSGADKILNISKYFIFIELQTLYNRKYIRDDALQSFRNNRYNKVIDRILEVRK